MTDPHSATAAQIIEGAHATRPTVKSFFDEDTFTASDLTSL